MMRPGDEDEVQLRKRPDLTLINAGLQRTVVVGSLWILAASLIAGVIGCTILAVHNLSTDPVKEIVIPVITGLLGILGGVFASGRTN